MGNSCSADETSRSPRERQRRRGDQGDDDVNSNTSSQSNGSNNSNTSRGQSRKQQGGGGMCGGACGSTATRKRPKKRPKVASLAKEDDETTLGYYRQILVDEEVLEEDECLKPHAEEMKEISKIQVVSSPSLVDYSYFATPRDSVVVSDANSSARVSDVASNKGSPSNRGSIVVGGSLPKSALRTSFNTDSNSTNKSTPCHSRRPSMVYYNPSSSANPATTSFWAGPDDCTSAVSVLVSDASSNQSNHYTHPTHNTCQNDGPDVPASPGEKRDIPFLVSAHSPETAHPPVPTSSPAAQDMSGICMEYSMTHHPGEHAGADGVTAASLSFFLPSGSAPGPPMGASRSGYGLSANSQTTDTSNLASNSIHTPQPKLLQREFPPPGAGASTSSNDAMFQAPVALQYKEGGGASPRGGGAGYHPNPSLSGMMGASSSGHFESVPMVNCPTPAGGLPTDSGFCGGQRPLGPGHCSSNCSPQYSPMHSARMERRVSFASQHDRTLVA